MTPTLRYVRADVRTDRQPRGFDVHHVAFLPTEGWDCSCGRRDCAHVAVVVEAVKTSKSSKEDK